MKQEAPRPRRSRTGIPGLQSGEHVNARNWLQRRVHGPDDRGSAILLWWVVTSFALLIVLGLIVDGGGKLHTDQQAQLAAEEAARSAGQAIITPLAKRGIAVVVDPVRAALEATRYLAAAGIVGTAIPTGPTTILVTTTKIYTPKVLGIIGLGPQTVLGEATIHINHTSSGTVFEVVGGNV